MGTRPLNGSLEVTSLPTGDQTGGDVHKTHTHTHTQSFATVGWF